MEHNYEYFNASVFKNHNLFKYVEMWAFNKD